MAAAAGVNAMLAAWYAWLALGVMAEIDSERNVLQTELDAEFVNVVHEDFRDHDLDHDLGRLFVQVDDQLANLGHYTRTTGPTFRTAVVLSGDELVVPTQLGSVLINLLISKEI